MANEFTTQVAGMWRLNDVRQAELRRTLAASVVRMTAQQQQDALTHISQAARDAYFGKLLEDHRETYGVDRAAAAREGGISREKLDSAERGATSLPHSATLARKVVTGIIVARGESVRGALASTEAEAIVRQWQRTASERGVGFGKSVAQTAGL